MTAATITEISYEDVPLSVITGTGLRRQKLNIRATVDAGGSNTIDLATYVPNIKDIEGIEYITQDGVVGTSPTWSTAVLTLVDVGVNEVGVVINLN